MSKLNEKRNLSDDTFTDSDTLLLSEADGSTKQIEVTGKQEKPTNYNDFFSGCSSSVVIMSTPRCMCARLGAKLDGTNMSWTSSMATTPGLPNQNDDLSTSDLFRESHEMINSESICNDSKPFNEENLLNSHQVTPNIHFENIKTSTPLNDAVTPFNEIINSAKRVTTINNRSLDFLFNTPKKENWMRRKSVGRKVRRLDLNDDVLLDLINDSRTKYEKRKEDKNSNQSLKRLSEDGEMSPKCRSPRHAKKRMRKNNTEQKHQILDHIPVSPIITNQHVPVAENEINTSKDIKKSFTREFDSLSAVNLSDDQLPFIEVPNSPIFGSCLSVDDNDDDAISRSPIIGRSVALSDFDNDEIPTRNSGLKDENSEDTAGYAKKRMRKNNVEQKHQILDHIPVSPIITTQHVPVAENEINTSKYIKRSFTREFNSLSAGNTSDDELPLIDVPNSPIFGSCLSVNDNDDDVISRSPIIGRSVAMSDFYNDEIATQNCELEDENSEDPAASPVITSGRYQNDVDASTPSTPSTTKFDYPTDTQIFEDTIQTSCNQSKFSEVSELNCLLTSERNEIKPPVENQTPAVDECKKCITKGKKFITGFSTAGGKGVNISEVKLKEVRKMFEEDESFNCKNNSFAGGFATAGGKKISVLEENLKKARKFFEEDKDEAYIGDERKMTETKETSCFAGGFATAGGKKISVLEENLKRARKLFEEDQKATKETNSFAGSFATAGGKIISVSEKSLSSAKKLFVEGENNFVGEFSTAEEKKILIPEEKLSKIRHVFDDIDFGDLLVKSKGFSTAGGKQISISEEMLNKSKKLFEGCEDVNGVVDSPKTDFGGVGFATAAGKGIKISDAALASAKKIFSDNSHSGESEKTCGFITADRKNIDVTNRSLKKLFESEGRQNDGYTKEEISGDPDDEIMREVMGCITDFLDTEENDFDQTTWSEIEKEIYPHRVAARNSQFHKIEEKKKEKVNPIPGWLLQRKNSHGKNRLRLSNFTGRPPRNYTEKELLEFGVKPSLLLLSSSTAENFKFIAKDFFPAFCEKDVIKFEIEGHDPLVLDDYGMAGKNEFYKCFLLTPGVDPALITEEWVFNHYRWIVWKLASMEIGFPQEFAGRCLTIENILLQLKFRYDQEVDQCKRSALMKILERDDCPGKMLVLCVSDIKWVKTENEQSSNLFVEVTDGWYKIPIVVDDAVHRLVCKDKIYIGQKLITHNAELVGSAEPCSPLQAPPELQLKLSMNSTRPAHWDLKLGYFYKSPFLTVPISSVNSDGGVISCVKAVVARVYPVQFMECLNNSYIFRNEKSEELAAVVHEQTRLDLKEKLINKVLKTIDEDEIGSSDDVSRKKPKKGDLKYLETGQEIYEALKYRNVSDNVESLLTEVQIKRLNDYRLKLADQTRQKVEKKVLAAIEVEKDEGRFPEDRVVIPFQRILLIGASKYDIKNNSSAMLTVWRPTEDLSEIREGQAMCFYNINAAKCRLQSKHVPLSTTKQTKYSSVSIGCDVMREIFFPRRVYNFSELKSLTKVPYDEVDVVGMVISIQARSSPAVVFLMDQFEDVLGIRFWNGSLLNVNCISVQNVIAASNLQKRSYNSGLIPYLDAGDSSLFTQMPKQTYLITAIEEIQTNDLKAAMESGLRKIKTAMDLRN